MLDTIQAAVDAVPPVAPIIFGLDATQLAGVAGAVGVAIATILGLRKGTEAQHLVPTPEPSHASVGGLYIDPGIGMQIVGELKGIKEAIVAERQSEFEDRVGDKIDD